MARRKKIASVEIQIDSVEIGKRAYEKWLARGCLDGYAQQDWTEAEAELRAEKAACVVAFEVREKEKKVEEKKTYITTSDGKNLANADAPGIRYQDEEHPNLPSGNGLNG